MRPPSLSPASSPYARTDAPAGTPSAPSATGQGTPVSHSPARGHGGFGNLPASPVPAASAGSRSPFSFAWRRSPWSQALWGTHAAHAQPETQHERPAGHDELDRPRLYDPRQRTLQAARDGRVPLAQGHVGGGIRRRDDAAVAENLLERIAAVAESTTNTRPARGEASSSSSRALTEPELDSRIASNDPATILTLAKQAAQRAREAAEAARDGSMAALVSAHQESIGEGSPSGGEPHLQKLRAHVGAARAHLDKLHAAVDRLQDAFGIFADEDEDGDDPELRDIGQARAMIEQARTALSTIESDTTHCLVAQAIAEHRLPPEAAVLGQVAALRELHPAAFQLDQGGGDPRVLAGMGELASRTARGLHELIGAADPGDRAFLQRLRIGSADVAQMLNDARQLVVSLRADCPPGATQDALGTLSNAIDDTEAWLAGQVQPGIGIRPLLSPHSPLLTPAAHTLPTNEGARARMAEFELQRRALSELPHLAGKIARDTTNDDAQARQLSGMIERVMVNAMGTHTPIDTRIELARVAMHFAPTHVGERVRLARALTGHALGIAAPTTGEVQATLGTDDYGERGSAELTRNALFDRLGDVMASLNPEEARRFAQSLASGWDVRDSRGHAGVSDIRRSALAIAQRRVADSSVDMRQLMPPRNPEEFGARLGSSAQRTSWIAGYMRAHSVSRYTTTPGDRDETASYVDNRTVIGALIRHASNMSAMRGHRHHFVKLVKELLKADDEQILSGHRPAVGSAQRLELLQAMVAQLPQFGHASGDRQTVSDVLALVLREMGEPTLRGRHRVRLAKELIGVTEHLSTSRFSGSDAAQAHALDSIGIVVRGMDGIESTALLRQVLASRQAWSAQRSAGADIARTRGKKQSVLASSLFPPVGLIHAATYASGVIKGRAGPRDEALEMVLDTLEERVKNAIDQGHPAPVELLPVYSDLLHQLLDTAAQPGAKPDQSSLTRTLGCIVRGGLPADGDAPARDRRVSMVLGDDPAMRAAVARSLTRAIEDKSGPAASPFGRLASARYLQNLLAAGAGGLDAVERQAALAAIHRAASSKSLNTKGRRESTMLNTLVREALRDGIPVKPEVLRRTVSQTLILLRAVPSVPLRIADAVTPPDRERAAAPVHDAAAQMRQLVSFYPTLEPNTRRELRAVMMASAPAAPAPRHELEAIQQLPLLAFATSLSQFAGTRAEDARELLQLHADVWPRLNATNQDAAISDMFDAYDEATPAGREAVLSFVRRLGEPGAFVSAAVNLIDRTVADETVRSALGEADSNRVIATVLERMRTLPAANASDLVASVLVGETRLPQPLIDGFVEHAGALQPRTLAQLLTTELNRVSTLPREEAAAVLANWDRTARTLPPGSSQRDTLVLFTAIAAQAGRMPGTQAARAQRVPVPEEAASRLSSALSTFEPRLQAVVLSHIAGEQAPEAVRRAIVDDLFRQFSRADAQQRQLTIRLGGRAGMGRALEALANEFGAPRLGGGARLGFDQTFLPDENATRARVGASSTLRTALEDPARRPEEICVALEAIADRFLALPETPFQQQFAEVFEDLVRNRKLASPPLLRRLVDTLTLADARQSPIGRTLLQRYGQMASPGIERVKPGDEARARLNELRAQRGALLAARAHPARA